MCPGRVKMDIPSSSGSTRVGPFLRNAPEQEKFLPERVREHNKALVLRTLYHGGQQSRADLARATRLARVTVGELVVELITSGIVSELGPREAGRPGKPATLLDIDTRSFVIVTVDLSQPGLFRGALVDLAGEIVDRAELAAPELQGAMAVDAVISLVDDLVARATAPVLGVGIGSPGIVGEGSVRKAPNLGWIDVDLAGIVARRFGLATVLANDADAAVLAERRWGGAADNVILIRVGLGVGAGVIIDGRLVRGGRFAAGEIGHVIVGTDGGAACACGKTGCLETWLSAPSVRRQITDEIGADDVRAAAGVRLGIALAPVVGILDVSEIVLSGPEDVLTEDVARSVGETISARAMTAEYHHLDVRLSELGDEGVLRGAAAQVLEARLGIV
jgi:predicted NBD/HSP70 family sugar kinase